MSDNIPQFYYKKSRLQQLKGFCYTVELGTARKAAEKMGLDPSAITTQIKSLEESLGIKLFYRDNNRLIPTKEAKMLYDMSIHYIYGIDNLFEKFINKLKNKESKIFNIGTHHIFASYVLPKYIKKLIDLHPNINITIHNLTIEESLKALRDDKIDILIFPISNIPDWCESELLFTYNPILLVNKHSPLAKKEEYTLQDLEEYDLVRISKDVITMEGFEELASNTKFKNIITLNRGTWEMLIGLVKANVGFTFIHTLFLNKTQEDLIVKSADKYLPKINYYLITKKGKVHKHYIDEFIKIINQK